MPVKLERPSAHPHVALVTIDRPDRANALDPRMLNELAGAWREIAADSELRCAVVTGAGERVFCGGMDSSSALSWIGRARQPPVGRPNTIPRYCGANCSW